MKVFYVVLLLNELSNELGTMQDSLSPDSKQAVSKTIADLGTLRETLVKECGAKSNGGKK